MPTSVTISPIVSFSVSGACGSSPRFKVFNQSVSSPSPTNGSAKGTFMCTGPAEINSSPSEAEIAAAIDISQNASSWSAANGKSHSPRTAFEYKPT